MHPTPPAPVARRRVAPNRTAAAGPLGPVLDLGLVLGLALALTPLPATAVSFHSGAIDVTANGNEIWVVAPDHAQVSVLYARTPATYALLAEIPVGREPWCLDTHPTNGEVWVASQRDDRIDIIDGPSRQIVASIDAGFGTFGVAFSPAGDVALVTASGSHQVFVVDVATRTITHTFDVPRDPRGIAWSPDGTTAWISHLLMPDYFGHLTVVDATTWTVSDLPLHQVYGTDRAGYPSCMQNITLAPTADILWLPTLLVNSAKGQLSGIPLTPTNIFHAVIRPVDVLTGTDLSWDTYFMSEGGTPNSGYAGGTTPVGGPIAVDFRDSRAYVVNLNSNNLTILNQNLMYPHEYGFLPVGEAPIGIVTHPDLLRAYVANWLGRSITAINTNTKTVIGEYPITTWEALPGQVLHGKKLFYTSTGRMSFEDRNSCSSCHVMGHNDARNWDLTQNGARIRATKDNRTVAFTGPSGWTAGSDEVQDNEWSIRNLLGGVGLIDGMPNPSLGAPNAGRSEDLDDLAHFVLSQRVRPDTPYLAPDGSLTADAEAGRTLFFDPVVGCAACHVPPFYTDSSMLESPFLRHDVGTGDADDPTVTDGLDTPPLVGVWDDAPYLHHHRAKTMEAVLTTFNPDDQHGVTSHLTGEEIGFLAAFVNSIGWPDSAGSAVDAPVVASASAAPGAATACPNPFKSGTSLRFSLDGPAHEVRVDVYDVAGRHVRTLLSRALPRGTHVLGWDGRNDTGAAVATGTYFARWSVDGARREPARMTVLR